MTRYKYKTGTGKKRIHLCGDNDMTLCKAENSTAVLNKVSDEKPPNRKICATCRKLAKNPKKAKGRPPTPKDKRLQDMAFVKSDRFLKSRQWHELRYLALKHNNGCCELCGRSKEDGIVLNVDHIKPRSKYPELALKLTNLQVLCWPCNHGKSNTDETDWREPSLAKLMGEAI